MKRRIQIQLIGSIVRRLCTEINVIFLVCIVLPDFSYIRQHRGRTMLPMSCIWIRPKIW